MSSILQCTCFPAPLSLPPPHSPVCCPTIPVMPNACSESGRTLVCMAYGLPCCSVWTLCLFVSRNPPIQVPLLQYLLLHDASCFVSRGDLVFPDVVEKNKGILLSGCLLLLHGFSVALKSSPLLVLLMVYVGSG